MAKSLLCFLSLFLLTTQAQRECGLGVEQTETKDFDTMLVEDGICQIGSIGLVGCPVTQQEVRDALLERNRYQYLQFTWKDFWERYPEENFDAGSDLDDVENLESWSVSVEGISDKCHLRAFCCSNSSSLRSLDDVLRRPDWKQRTFPHPENELKFGLLLGANYHEVVFSWINLNVNVPFNERWASSVFAARSDSSSGFYMFAENMHSTESDEVFVAEWDELNFEAPCVYHFSSLEPTKSVENEELTQSSVTTEVLQWSLDLPVVTQNGAEISETRCSESVAELSLAAFSNTASRSPAPLTARPSWFLLFVLVLPVLLASDTFRSVPWHFPFFLTLLLCSHGAHSADVCAELNNDEPVADGNPYCNVFLVGVKDSCPKTRTEAKEVILRDSFEFLVMGSFQITYNRQFDANGKRCTDCHTIQAVLGSFGLTPSGCFVEFACSDNVSLASYPTAASLLEHPLFDCLPQTPTPNGSLFKFVSDYDTLQLSWDADNIASFNFVLENGTLVSPGLGASFAYLCSQQEVRKRHSTASRNDDLAAFRLPCKDEKVYRTAQRHFMRDFVSFSAWESYKCRFALNRQVYFNGTAQYSCSESPVHMTHEQLHGELPFESATTGLAAWAVVVIVLACLVAVFAAVWLFIHYRRQSSPKSLGKRTRKYEKEEEQEEEDSELELSEVKAVVKEVKKPQPTRRPRPRPGLPPGQYVMVMGKDGTPVMTKRSR